MIAQHYQPTLLVSSIDSPRCVGQNRGFNSHAPEHPHRKGNFLRRVSFVEMHPALHCRHNDTFDFADDQSSRMSYRRRFREAWNFLVRNPGRLRQFIRESAQARTQYQHDLRPQLCLGEYEFRGAFGLREFARPRRPLLRSVSCAHDSMIPTIDADIRFAIVPAALARIPSRARSAFLFGASAPMPPI